MPTLILISASGLAAIALGGIALLGLYPIVPLDLGGAPNLDRRARRVRIPVDENDWIAGWHLAGRRNAVVLVFHGYGRNHCRAWRYGAFLHQAGYHVLAVDFRSSRTLGRKPTTLGHFELPDAQATIEWVRRQPALEGLRIGVLGESLGGAVALLLAARNPDVAAVVADCAFATGRLALEASCERWAHLPRWPSASILRSLIRNVTGRDPGQVDALAAASGLCDRPVLFIHGMLDNRFSPDQARRLWRAAGSKDPLWLIPDAGHNQGWKKHRAIYEQRVGAFLARHLLSEGVGLPAGEL
jgi:fermentation-respiration switch protein FrsA (DUF1100 family)